MPFLLKYLKNKQVTVLGAGSSGIAAARLLNRNGVQVFISENQPEADKREEKKILEKQKIPFEFGGHSDKIYEADLLVISPGISWDDARVKKAREKGISVYGELEVAFWYCQAPIIAVTGSNGKSTTTALIGNIFKNTGKKYQVVGNIGEPFAEVADLMDKKSTAIIEVSSFQLESIHSFRPRVAVFLNLTPDHLDRHASMQTYGRLKARIFKNQVADDFLIYNGQDAQVSTLVQNCTSQKIVFGKKQPSDSCGYIDKGKLVFQMQGKKKELIDLDDIYLKGRHNAGNALAAVLSARIMNIDWEPIRQTLETFKGLPHRMEYVRRKNNVTWINDSKATNVESVWYALDSFQVPVILIAGGKDKDGDFTKLYDQVAKKAKQVILLGEAASKMEKVFKGIPVRVVGSLKQAVKLANSAAEPGDVVLLSPSCASFDMFSNFEERGNTFKTLVNNL